MEIKQENKMLKMVMGSILLAVLLIACTSSKGIDDWEYVPCNGTNTECGNLDGNKRNNG